MEQNGTTTSLWFPSALSKPLTCPDTPLHLPRQCSLLLSTTVQTFITLQSHYLVALRESSRSLPSIATASTMPIQTYLHHLPSWSFALSSQRKQYSSSHCYPMPSCFSNTSWPSSFMSSQYFPLPRFLALSRQTDGKSFSSSWYPSQEANSHPWLFSLPPHMSISNHHTYKFRLVETSCIHHPVSTHSHHFR